MRRLLVEADPRADAALVERVDRLYAAARDRPVDPAERLARRRAIADGDRAAAPGRSASATTRSCCGCAATTSGCSGSACAIDTSTGSSRRATSPSFARARDRVRDRPAAALRARPRRLLRAVSTDRRSSPGASRASATCSPRRRSSPASRSTARGSAPSAPRSGGPPARPRPAIALAAACRRSRSPRSSQSSARRRSSMPCAPGGSCAARIATRASGCGAGDPSSPTCSTRSIGGCGRGRMSSGRAEPGRTRLMRLSELVAGFRSFHPAPIPRSPRLSEDSRRIARASLFVAVPGTLARRPRLHRPTRWRAARRRSSPNAPAPFRRACLSCACRRAARRSRSLAARYFEHAALAAVAHRLHRHVRQDEHERHPARAARRRRRSGPACSDRSARATATSTILARSHDAGAGRAPPRARAASQPPAPTRSSSRSRATRCDSDRVDGLRFDGGLLAAIMPGEHTDFHRSYEDYVEAKRLLPRSARSRARSSRTMPTTWPRTSSPTRAGGRRTEPRGAPSIVIIAGRRPRSCSINLRMSRPGSQCRLLARRPRRGRAGLRRRARRQGRDASASAGRWLGARPARACTGRSSAAAICAMLRSR